MKNGIIGLIVILMVVGLVVGLVKVNQWIQGQVGDIVDVPEPVTSTTETVEPPEPEATKPKRRTGEVTRKTRLAPERSFEISVFYQGGEEIARHKVNKKGEIYDQEGEIPSGRIKFINETDQTYGAEFYRSGRRDGPMEVYYRDGALKIEANYQYGRLLTLREYYHDGTVKMEKDLTDAREFNDDRDTGVGKMYDRAGRVKYEWRIINTDPVGYYKSYNQKGRLTSTVYIDQAGNRVEPKAEVTVNPPAPQPASSAL